MFPTDEMPQMKFSPGNCLKRMHTHLLRLLSRKHALSLFKE